MKKIIALLLASIMVLGMVACGTTKEDDKKEEAKKPETVGEILLDAFEDNPEGTAQEIAERIIGNDIIPFRGGVNPIEPGLLSGFDNTEITGFKEGCMFGPMMGTIPFVGYIFVLEDGADVDAFEKTLEDNANLRWNICTEAEEMILEAEEGEDGYKVLFLMCPKSFEE